MGSAWRQGAPDCSLDSGVVELLAEEFDGFGAKLDWESNCSAFEISFIRDRESRSRGGVER